MVHGEVGEIIRAEDDNDFCGNLVVDNSLVVLSNNVNTKFLKRCEGEM